MQKTETDTCGVFQFYFYENLFLPDHNSSILNDENPTKKTISKLLIKYLN